MFATYLVGLCQAVDLRHLEENMRSVVKHIVLQAARKTLYTAEDGSLLDTRFCEKELLQVIDHQPVFSYIDDPTNPSYALMLQLREVLVDESLRLSCLGKDGESDHNLEAADASGVLSNWVFGRIPLFQQELKARLEDEVPKARERFDKGDFPIANRINKCRTYPIYRFVRSELGTDLLTGPKWRSPGEDIEKVFEGICEGKMGEVILKCLDAWRGCAGPFTPRAYPASPAAFNTSYWAWFDNTKSPSATSGRGFWSAQQQQVL